MADPDKEEDDQYVFRVQGDAARFGFRPARRSKSPMRADSPSEGPAPWTSEGPPPWTSEGSAFCIFDDDLPSGEELREALKLCRNLHGRGLEALDAKSATQSSRTALSPPGSRRGSRAQGRSSSPCPARRRPSSTATSRESSRRSSKTNTNSDSVSDGTGSITLQAVADPATCAIVLDWDDTLCPTTWLREDVGLDWTMPLDEVPNPQSQRNVFVRKLVDAHVASVKSFLVEASKHGKIIILTLAQRPWVEISLKHWMPDLAAEMKELAIGIVYAQEHVDEDELEAFETDEAGDEAVHGVWTHAKESALITTLDASPTSWSQIISIGDSEYERQAAIEAGKKLQEACPTQTLKLLEDPSIEELTGEIKMLERWISYLARCEGDFDDTIDSPEDDQLQELHERITGEADNTVTWSEFCGLEE